MKSYIQSSKDFFHVPIFIKDVYKLCKYIYISGPSINSRIFQVILKHSLDHLVFYNSPLAKDGNPVSSAIIREVGNFLPNAYNAYKAEPLTLDSPEIQDTLHVLGQGGRIICKSGIQYLPKYFSSTNQTLDHNTSFVDPVILSRISNIGCDSVSISATLLSRQSQKEGHLLYFLLQNTNSDSTTKTTKNGFSYLYENLSKKFILSVVPKVMFKSLILDQMGEIVKLFQNTTTIKFISDSVKENYNLAISYTFNIDSEKLDHTQDIYTQCNVVLKDTNYNINGYFSCLSVGTFKVLYTAIPDLLITGVIMLSFSNIAINFMNGFSVLQTTATLALGGLASHYKNEIIEEVSKSSVILGITALSLTISDTLYEIAQAHPVASATLLAGAVTVNSLYSHQDSIMNGLESMNFITDEDFL